MPYLLDLPPLDNNDNTVKIKEITDVKDEVKIKTKNASKKKTSVQDIEVEKWHCVTATANLVDPAENNTSSSSTKRITNCDTSQKFSYDCKSFKLRKFIDLNDKDMEVLRNLSQKLKNVKQHSW